MDVSDVRLAPQPGWLAAVWPTAFQSIGVGDSAATESDEGFHPVPSLLKFDVETYNDFRERRRAAIFSQGNLAQ
jgi:hypothetical protein